MPKIFFIKNIAAHKPMSSVKASTWSRRCSMHLLYVLLSYHVYQGQTVYCTVVNKRTVGVATT